MRYKIDLEWHWNRLRGVSHSKISWTSKILTISFFFFYHHFFSHLNIREQNTSIWDKIPFGKENGIRGLNLNIYIGTPKGKEEKKPKPESILFQWIWLVINFLSRMLLYSIPTGERNIVFWYTRFLLPYELFEKYRFPDSRLSFLAFTRRTYYLRRKTSDSEII